ncbi:MAG: HupE / UreJ protein [Flavobacteriales bacterium]|nr:MAG: HupE / UreJ protein [Flavobacteriales bacterium]PIE49874.1 MAG: HupE / UreJ protein [Flavobacteriales bacterium]
MEDFLLYIKLGLTHVLDFNGYDHVLFLMVLAVVYMFKDFKMVFWLVTFFTIGHTLTLVLAAYKLLFVSISVVEFLIPLTIFITALANLLTLKKNLTTHSYTNLFFALVFGLIHGLGFSNYFRMRVDSTESKLLPLVSFAIGIEIAQVIVVLGILTLGYVAQHIIKITRRDWIFFISALVMGMVIPMLIDRKFW